MRAQLSEQDLTDYALNELAAPKRFYVESMLAVSEECRNDIYETIETAMMIEQGFELAEDRTAITLTTEQRGALLAVRGPNHFLRRSVAGLAAAAALALAFVHKDTWLPRGPVSAEVARVSSQMTHYVAQAVSSTDAEDFVSPLESFRKLTDEPGKWLPTQPPAGATIFGAGPLLQLEVTPHAGIYLMP